MALLEDAQLAALEQRIRIAEDWNRETVSIKPATLKTLIANTRALSRLLVAAQREVAANNCWCANWPGPGTVCSWCQLRSALP